MNDEDNGKVRLEMEGNLLHVTLTNSAPGTTSFLELKADGEVIVIEGSVPGSTFHRMSQELVGCLPDLLGPLTGARSPSAAESLISQLPEIAHALARSVRAAAPPPTSEDDVLGESLAVVCDHCPKRWTPDGLLRRPVPECEACPVGALPH